MQLAERLPTAIASVQIRIERHDTVHVFYVLDGTGSDRMVQNLNCCLSDWFRS